MYSLIPSFQQPATTDESLQEVAAFSKSVLQGRRTQPQQLLMTSLDQSGSVFESGAIHEFRRALPKFVADLQKDAAIRAGLLATFSVFSNDSSCWQITAPFSPVMELTVPSLQPSNSTPLCTRIIKEVQLLKARRNLVQEMFHVDQRHAWIVEMTDGVPTDSGRAAEARKAIQEEALEAGIEVYLFGVGEGADMRFLQSVAQADRPAEMLDSDRDFAKLFNWIYESLRITSRSMTGTVTEIESLSGRIIRTE